MTISPDEFIEGVSVAEHERLIRCGLRDPDRLDWEREHDDRLDARDRAEDRAGRSWGHLAYRDRPSSMERREHFDENRVRSLTHPRSGTVEVQPRVCPVDEAA